MRAPIRRSPRRSRTGTLVGRGTSAAQTASRRLQHNERPSTNRSVRITRSKATPGHKAAAAAAAADPAPPTASISTRTRSKAAAADAESLDSAALGSSSAAPSRSNSSSSSRGDKGSTKTVTKTVTCSICLDDVSSATMHRLGACRHSFCASCLSSYLKSCLKSKHLPAVCPDSGCQRVVTHRDAATLLAATPRLRNQFIEASKEASAIRRGSAIYCPNSSCSRLVAVRKLGAAAAKKLAGPDRARRVQEMAKGECKHCGEACCTSCRVGWHAGLSCTQYAALPPSERGEADMALWQLSDRQRWKRCPGCRSLVERTNGCNYMMCRCGKPFCYACGSDIDTCYRSGCLSGRALVGW